jgi:hypothetical protein
MANPWEQNWTAPTTSSESTQPQVQPWEKTWTSSTKSSSEIDPDFQNKILPIEGGVDKSGNFLTSPAGAIGPAQVMPKTAPEAAAAAGLEFDDYKYRNDAEYNKTIGNAHFKKMKDIFGGDAEKAAAAYNSGARRVKEAIDTYGESWREHLPDETKNYIQKFGKSEVKSPQGNPFILPKGKSTNPFVTGTTQPTAEDNNGWIPTMEQMKHEGFAGRVLTGLGVFEKPLEPAVQEPEMSLKESLKAMGESIISRPLDTAKAITRGLIEDPELLYPGLWATAPVKIAGTLGKIATAGKAAGSIMTTGNATRESTTQTSSCVMFS